MLKKIFAQNATLRLACLSCAIAIGGRSPLFCQRVKWEISGTTEGLWNITDGKAGWCNLLEVSAETGLWKGAGLEAAAISTYNLGIPVAGDLQAFSCIDAGPDKAFRLIEAGIRQDIGDKCSVYAGLRNIDMDHFTTPFTALFTNASHGNFPILSANFPLATYPLAALCLHAEFSPLQGLTLRESLYNGVASDRINRQFRFCPRGDGMFNIGSLSYHIGEEGRHHGYYAVGYALGSSPSETSPDKIASKREQTGLARSLPSVSGQSKTFNYALWTLIEQPLLHVGESHLGAMWQGGTSPASRSTCRHYWGAGLIWSNIPPRMTQVGLVVNRALYADGRETDVELTGSFPVCDHFTLQPAVHCINTGGNYTAAAQLRAILEFGN